jgi:hypothetical protein
LSHIKDSSYLKIKEKEMKQFLLTTMALFMAAGAFAEGAELSGKIEIDYVLTQTEAEADPVVLGNFDVDDAELAFKYAVSDVVTTKWEVEAKDGAAGLTEGWLSWAAADFLTLTFGLFDQTLGPNIYADSAIGVDFGFDFDIVALNLEIGNDDDDLTADSAALRIVPAITIAPELGEDLSLEVITGISLITNDPAELDFDIALSLGLADLSFDAEFLASDLEATAEGEVFLGLAYGLGAVEPYAELVMETVLSDAVINLEIGAGIDVAEGLSLTPYLGLENLQDTAAWEFGLVFVAKPKITF